MPSGSGLIHSSRASRAIYILSIFLVFFYIFFDVLDLDGSSFPRLFTPVGRTIIVALMPSVVQLDYSTQQSGLSDDIDLPFADRSGLNLRPPWDEAVSPSPLDAARSHRYRVGLARNSL